jgi:hypothetical protein
LPSVAKEMDVWTHRVAQQLMNPLLSEDKQWMDLDLQSLSDHVTQTWNSMLFTCYTQRLKTRMDSKEEHVTHDDSPIRLDHMEKDMLPTTIEEIDDHLFYHESEESSI